jgi:hypothetical protein
MSKWWFYLLASVTAAIWCSAVVMILMVIWAPGPDSTRWALTAVVAAAAGAVTSFFAAVASDAL